MGTKTIKSNADSNAGVVVANNVVRMNVDEDNGVSVSEKGVTISGPVSFVSATNHIRFGGLWTFNNPTTMMIPSTLATPSPTLLVDPPMKQMQDLISESLIMLSMLG